ncbi:NIPSNAP family containing protein [Nocardioides marmoriginsengisoli]|uniref:NIPSNAP family containing protein n=1 Tax=Nocardioides marmoriginsengisoli TaxID=661483 RepID=A0A3N0CB69_9ACTN|nr:NIPSNAP family protein [Nocardioides marmoriginsengisoli]RNL60678.1 NIPSNAP family containing protein [Nocardioides marmoriginsengisoli]
MQLRLRTYTLREGREAEFVERWNETLVPLRREVGFEVLGSWFSAATREFVWIVGWPGEGDYDAAEQAYYDSPLRAQVPWDAAEYVEAVDIRAVDDVFTAR